MYVDRMQRLGLLEANLPNDTWEDERTREGVWLYAADLCLRRTFLVGQTNDAALGRLAPSMLDIRLAGAGGDCSLLGKYTEPDRPGLEVFIFAGDAVKWYDSNHAEFGKPEAYEQLAGTIAGASAERWRLSGVRVEQFVARQTLIWSVQAARLQHASPEEVSSLVDDVHRHFHGLWDEAPGGPVLAGG